MKIKPTETVTIDELTYPVNALPDEIKAMVETYDDIRKDAEKARLDTIKCQSALTVLGNQIAAAIKEMQKVAPEATDEATDD